MQYDPIKNVLADFVRKSPLLRRIFYMVLSIMFLREWYVRRKIREIYIKNPPVRILDAGSGFGQYSYFMMKLFPNAKLLGIDVKEDQIEDCNYFFNKIGYNNAKFEIGDLTKLEEKEKYELILSVDVMEHIEDDRGVFKRFYNALKKNGRVIINTPSDLGGSDADHEEDESFIGEHVRNGYSKEDIINKLRDAGFDIDSFEYTYGKWGNRYWRLGIKYPMLMVNRSKLLLLFLPLYYIFTIIPVLIFMTLDINEKNKKAGTGILAVGIKH